MIRDRLSEAIEWMESMRCEWCGHDPFVVRLVQVSVDHGVMQTAMNPVDQKISEQEEEWELQPIVCSEGSL